MAKGIKPKILVDLPDEVRYLSHIAAGRNPGWIYMLVASDLGLVKIGASNRWDGLRVAVDRRIREVKNAAAIINIDRELVVVASALGRNETEIHKHFNEYRVAGEWFIFADAVQDFVESVARLLDQLEEWGENADARPTETPWRMLEIPARPPSRKFVGLEAVFE